MVKMLFFHFFTIWSGKEIISLSLTEGLTCIKAVAELVCGRKEKSAILF